MIQLVSGWVVGGMCCVLVIRGWCYTALDSERRYEVGVLDDDDDSRLIQLD
jgi:hypothetical protein